LAERCSQDVAGDFVRRVVCAEDNVERRTERVFDAHAARAKRLSSHAAAYFFITINRKKKKR
jgi:hypothetical protein